MYARLTPPAVHLAWACGVCCEWTFRADAWPVLRTVVYLARSSNVLLAPSCVIVTPCCRGSSDGGCTQGPDSPLLRLCSAATVVV